MNINFNITNETIRHATHAALIGAGVGALAGYAFTPLYGVTPACALVFGVVFSLARVIDQYAKESFVECALPSLSPGVAIVGSVIGLGALYMAHGLVAAMVAELIFPGLSPLCHVALTAAFAIVDLCAVNLLNAPLMSFSLYTN